MASTAKRQKTELEVEAQSSDEKAPPSAEKDGKILDQELSIFMKWCEDFGFDVNEKVRVCKHGSISNYGMVAIGNIGIGETLFTVPREVLLHPDNCSISLLLKQARNELQSTSGWAPLLLCLMYEYTNADSKWRPYLDLCPDFTQLDPPLFWNREMVIKELKGTGIPELVDRDTENIQEEYDNVAVPFMKKNVKHFNLEIHTLDLYRKMVAFVMAYSFTEPKKPTRISQDDDDGDDDDDEEEDEDVVDGDPPAMPMMVPMADILNHVAKNNARLQFGEKSLSMVSTRTIQKNEEVFNTYGELENSQLLHMYGFAEPYPDNIYDIVDIPLMLLKNQSNSSLPDDLDISQWEFMTESEENYDESIVIGCDGVINKWETYNALKLLGKTPAEFAKHYFDDDEDEEDDFEEWLSFDGMQDLPTPWKKLLHECAIKQLQSYKNSLEGDLSLLKEHNTGSMTSREVCALHVRIGQKKLVEKVVSLSQ